MCVFQPAGMGGWSSWSMRISSSPSSIPWLRQMLCSTQQARMIWQTFSGLYSSLPMHPNIATFPSACLCCAPLPTAHGICCIEVGFLGCLSVRNRGEKLLGTLFYAENPLSHFAVPGHCMDIYYISDPE